MKKLLLFIFLLFHSIGFSNPTGENIVNGIVSISRQDTTLTINQSSNKAIINWNEFSIASNEITNFIQNSNASILNRVTGNNLSEIYGQLNANGKVFLLNEKGIFIGPNGQINAASFIASTLKLNDEDYLKNNLHFKGDSDSKIQNLGTINSLNGKIFLIAKDIENTGSINAQEAGLAGSQDVFLFEEGKERLIVSKESLGSVTNQGVIEAAQVELKASGGNIYSLAINQKGIITATGIEEKDGKIILKAESQTTQVSGTLIATNENNTGGSVQVLGETVKITDEALIDVSASFNGGEVLIGGDYQGQNPNIKNATTTYIEEEALIKADALINGDGGKVICWGNEFTGYYGNISAKGGINSGNGGFTEVSAHNVLDFHGLVDLRAVNGTTGTLLLDPSDVFIQIPIATNMIPSGGNPNTYSPVGNTSYLLVGDLQTALGLASVIVITNGAGVQSGDIYVNNAVTWATVNYLTLTADRHITISATVTNTGGANINFNYGQTTGGTLTVNSAISTTGTLTIVGGANDDVFDVNINPATQLPTTTLTGAGGTNTFFGPNIVNNWTIDGDNVGSLGNINFFNFSDIYGGTTTDTFTFTGPYQISGFINGLFGTNTIVGPNLANAWEISGGGAGQIFPSTATGATTFSSVFNLKGGTGTDTLTRTSASDPATWTLNADNGGTLEGITFTQIENLVGKANSSDRFAFLGAYQITGLIDAGTGTGVNYIQGPNGFANAWTIDGDDQGTIFPPTAPGASSFIRFPTLYGGTGNDTFTFNGPFQISNFINGLIGSNTIVGAAAEVNAWEISANNQGTITPGAGGTTTFQSINALTGGAAGNTVTRTSTSATGSWNVTANDTGLLHSITFTGIENWVGKANSNDTFQFNNAYQGAVGGTIDGGTGTGVNYVIGPNLVNTWTIDGDDTGTITPGVAATSNFTNITRLWGSNSTDTFTFTGAHQISDLIDGNGGSNTIVGAAAEFNTWEISANNQGTITPGAGGKTTFVDIDILTGGAVGNTLTRTSASATGFWNVTANDTGSLHNITFTGIENWVGKANSNDTYTFNNAYQAAVGGTINGGAQPGTNVIWGPNDTNIWTIDGDDTGTITPGVAATTNFTNITRLYGNNGIDTYTFTGIYQISELIDGNGGNNTIVGPNFPTTWAISGSQSGTIFPTTATGTTSFLDIDVLTGGSGNDAITVQPSGTLTTINLGAGTNTLTMQAGAFGITTVNGSTGTDTYNLLGGIITTFNPSTGDDLFNVGGTIFGGVLNGNGGTNTIAVGSGTTTWTLSGPANSGNVTGTILAGALTFSDIQNLTGGTGDDTFDINAGGSFTNITLAGGTNTLDYQNYGSPISVNFQTGVSTGATLVDTSNLTSILADPGFLGSIIGPNFAGTTTWLINAPNGGSIINSGVSLSTTFTDIDTFVGGTINDTFDIEAGGSVVNVTLSSGTNLLDYQSYGAGAIVDLQTGIVSGITNPVAGITNLSSIIGDTTNFGTIIGSNAANETTWAITDNNAGTISPIGASGSLSFSNISDLTGGTRSDSFVISDQMGISGLVDGGSDLPWPNTLDYSDYTTVFSVTLPNGPATNMGSITRIQGVIYPEEDLVLPTSEVRQIISTVVSSYEFDKYTINNTYDLWYSLDGFSFYTDAGNIQRIIPRYLIEDFKTYTDQTVVLMQNMEAGAPFYLALESKIKNKEVLALLIDDKKEVLTKQKTDGNTPLYMAVESGIEDKESLELLIDNNKEVLTKHNKDGKTPLYLALEKNIKDKETLELLIDNNKEVLTKHSNDWKTPLYLALQKGIKDKETLELLIDNNKEVLTKQNNDWNTPLHLALEIGIRDKEVLELLVDNNKEVLTIQNIDENTPLYLAFLEGAIKDKEVLELLIDNNKEVLTMQTINGKTPLYLALQKGIKNIEVLELLVDDNREVLMTQTAKGNTPFNLAFLEMGIKDRDVLELLIDENEGVLKGQKEDSNTPLYLAFLDMGIKDKEFLEVLIDEKQDVLRRENTDENTLLYLAIERGVKDAEMLELLIDENEEVLTKQNANGNTALYLALQKGITDKDIIEVLIDHNKDVLTQQNAKGKTPFNLVFLEMGIKDREVLRLLIDDNEDVLRKQNNEDNTLLYLALEKGITDKEVIELLIDRNKDVLTQQNAKGNTALYLALERGLKDKEVLQLLIDDNKEVLIIQNAEGNTPLYMALERGIDKEVLKLFITR